MKTQPEHVTRWRAAHHAALAALFPAFSGSPLDLWRKLRRIESRASRAAVQWCNGEIDSDRWESVRDSVLASIAALNGGTLPAGVFVNSDPRGYALKVEEDAVPAGMHTDWGRYGILAAVID